MAGAQVITIVDLHPAGAFRSDAYASTGSQQGGRAIFGANSHAGIWFGTAESYVDMSTSLGAAYENSEVEALWADGSTLLAAGYARI